MDIKDSQKIQLDYQHTFEQFKMLADICFKLLQRADTSQTVAAINTQAR